MLHINIVCLWPFQLIWRYRFLIDCFQSLDTSTWSAGRLICSSLSPSFPASWSSLWSCITSDLLISLSENMVMFCCMSPRCSHSINTIVNMRTCSARLFDKFKLPLLYGESAVYSFIRSIFFVFVLVSCGSTCKAFLWQQSMYLCVFVDIDSDQQVYIFWSLVDVG